MATIIRFGVPGPQGPSATNIISAGAQGLVAMQAALTTATAGQLVLFGQNTNTNAGSGSQVDGTLNTGSNKFIQGGQITGVNTTDTPCLAITGSNNVINGLTLNVPTATALQMNSSGANNNIVTNCNLTATNGYCVLHNDATSNGFIVANNVLYSGTADGIEINHPTHPASNVIIMGNIITAAGAASGGSAGFGIGIAQARGVPIIGNALQNTRQGGMHIEDLSNQVVIVGNTITDCQKEGITLQVPVPGKGFPEPLTGGYNSFRHTGTKTGFNGLACIGDANGNVKQVNLSNNVLNGFDTGEVAPDTTHAMFSGNIILNCNTGMVGVKHARIMGLALLSGTPALAIGQSGSVMEGGISQTTLTSILAKNGGNFPGPALEKWGHPVTFTHTGSGTEFFNLAPLPSCFSGMLHISIEGGGPATVYLAEVIYDGTTLTVNVKLIKNSGSIGAIVPTLGTGGNAGQLQIGIFSASGFTNTMVAFFGRGSLWVQNS